jgi:hypothetical protein
MELIIFFGALALLGVAALIGGADSRPGINESHEWGLHHWTRDD